MKYDLLQSLDNDIRFKLDPLTKIILLISINMVVFSNTSIYIIFILASIPFFLLFLSNQKKKASIYIIFFIFAKFLDLYLVPFIHGPSSLIIVIITNLIAKMMPTIVMAYYVLTTTKVSEFIASMERIKMPRTLIIPLSVLFRFFPSLIEEIQSIYDAMRMRGIGFNIKSIKSPILMLEYVFVPMLTSAVKTGDELAAASLTRGIDNPVKRTNICKNKITIYDIILIATAIILIISFTLDISI